MAETVDISEKNPIRATGRRKTAVAQVRVIPGDGKLLINSKSLEDFLAGHQRHKYEVMQPIKLAKSTQGFDIFISVSGGGVTGQTEAARLGISRALVKIDPNLKSVFRKEGLLSRDPRMVERKKPGQPKARKKYQWTKR